MDYRDLGYTGFMDRSVFPNETFEDTSSSASNALTSSALGTSFQSTAQISTIPSNSISLGQTTIGTLVANEEIKSGNFVTGVSGWRIQGNGDVEFSSGTFRGAITATSGTIGGWTIGATSLYSTNISIDSANERIQSANYVAGVSGFRISSSLIEAENLVARGIMKGTTFQYNVVSAVGGQLLVSNADVLASDMTALDASTLTTKGTTTWAVNDMLLIQAVTASGIQTEYLRITNIGSAPTYIVTRDLAGAYGANANPIWLTGTTISKIGTSNGIATYGGGWLRLFGEGTNSPYYSVFARTGVAYNSYSERVRMGNLNGIGGKVTDCYGIFMGDYAANQYAMYDDISGTFVLKGTITATAGSIGGFDIGSDYIRDAGNSMGLASTVTGGDDVRFWAGDTYANRATAPFNVTEAGVLTATDANIIYDCTLEEDMAAGVPVGFANLLGSGTDVRIAKAIQNLKTFALTNLTNTSMVFIPLDTTRFFILYVDSSNLRGIIATIDWDTLSISVGSSVSYSSSPYTEAFSACLVDTDKVAIIYVESGDTNHKYIDISTISTSTITKSGAQEFAHDGGVTTNIRAAQVQTNKGAIITEENGQSGVYCFTVSGTTPTIGARVQINVGFKKTVRIIGLDTDKIVVMNCYTSDTLYCGSISGTTITLGTVSNMADMNDSDQYNDLKKLDSTHFLVGYFDGSGSSAKVCSVSSTTITQGSSLSLGSTASTGNDTGYNVVDSSTVYASQPLVGSATQPSIRKLTVSGTTLTDAGYLMNSAIGKAGSLCLNSFMTINNRFVLMEKTNAAATVNYSIQGMSNNFAGFLTEAGSKGDVKGITVRGSLGGGFTGLIPGALYTVSNGTLTFTSTVATSIDTYAEQALIMAATDTQAIVF